MRRKKSKEIERNQSQPVKVVGGPCDTEAKKAKG
jgi:hypothetical protein